MEQKFVDETESQAWCWATVTGVGDASLTVGYCYLGSACLQSVSHSSLSYQVVTKQANGGQIEGVLSRSSACPRTTCASRTAKVILEGWNLVMLPAKVRELVNHESHSEAQAAHLVTRRSLKTEMRCTCIPRSSQERGSRRSRRDA